MTPESSPVSAGRVKQLIAEFRAKLGDSLTPTETELLQRIEADPARVASFAKLQDQVVTRLLHLCCEANGFQTFEERLKKAHDDVIELSELEFLLERLTKFLQNARTPVRDRLRAGMAADPDELSLELYAVGSIKSRIGLAKCAAAETPRRLGATRKCHGEGASETAAIGWIADGVRQITKRKNEAICLDIAGVVLNCTVTSDRLNNAIETRKREWRVPVWEHHLRGVYSRPKLKSNGHGQTTPSLGNCSDSSTSEQHGDKSRRNRRRSACEQAGFAVHDSSEPQSE